MIDLDMVGLVTKDMAESIRFYRTLGLEVPDPAPGQDYHDTKLASGVRLSWNTVDLIKQVDPHWNEANGPRLGIAFACASPADVDSTYRRLVDAGFNGSKEPWDAFWGYRYALLRDPDGNSVDLFAPLS